MCDLTVKNQQRKSAFIDLDNALCSEHRLFTCTVVRETLAKYKGALEIGKCFYSTVPIHIARRSQRHSTRSANEARDEATRRAEIADGKLHAIASTLTSKSPPQEKDRWGRQ